MGAPLKYFATALPGFGFALRREIDLTEQLRSRGEVCGDRRNDLVPFDGLRGERGLGLRTSEDVFVHLATHTAPRDASTMSSVMLRASPLESALSVWAAVNHPLRRSMTYRVIARVQSERRFRRTELRAAMAAAIKRIRPRWRADDPATLELWVVESRPDRFHLGLRLTTASMRHRGRRRVERGAALRPTAAAAMLIVSERSAPDRILDPCCGSGTILTEAAALGLRPIGSDHDRVAVDASRRNFGSAVPLTVADVRGLPMPACSVDAVVSNLPFGHAHTLQGNPIAWYSEALRDIARVVRPGGSAVLLMPDGSPVRRSIEQCDALKPDLSRPVELLGQRINLWRFTRV